MKKRWQDDLPEGAPKPRHRETRGNYAMRILREAHEKSIDRLHEAVRKRRDERSDDNE